MLQHSYNLLLVEDEPLIARVTQITLKKASQDNYQVTHCMSLADARDVLARQEIDLILLDLNLPDSSGIDTVTSVIEFDSNTPVIVLTATDCDEVGLTAVQKGAQDYLVKGKFDASLLQRTIRFAYERHQLQQTVRRLAVIDELTGLYNRRGFQSLHQDIIQKVDQFASIGFLCYFDLDDFKPINDRFGHHEGDNALVEFAGLLKTNFRKNVQLARLGGDEFVALGVNTANVTMNSCIQNLREALEMRNNDSATYRLATSIGTTTFRPGQHPMLDQLLTQADQALYLEKQKKPSSRVHQVAG